MGYNSATFHIGLGVAMARGRPRTRVAVVSEGARSRMGEVFGTAAQAWRALRLEGIVPYDRFYRAFRGDPQQPGFVKAIELNWERWLDRMGVKSDGPR